MISYGKKPHLRFRGRGVPDRRLMPLPAHSTSADHPVVPCNAHFRSLRSSLDSAMGTAVGSACPGDCAPRGNGSRIAAGLGAAVSPRVVLQVSNADKFVVERLSCVLRVYNR